MMLDTFFVVLGGFGGFGGALFSRYFALFSRCGTKLRVILRYFPLFCKSGPNRPKPPRWCLDLLDLCHFEHDEGATAYSCKVTTGSVRYLAGVPPLSLTPKLLMDHHVETLALYEQLGLTNARVNYVFAVFKTGL